MSTSSKKLPTINEKLVLEIWDWINFKAGTDGFPAYFQPSWVREISALNNAEWMENYKEDRRAASYEEGYCGTACCVAGYALLEQTDVKAGLLIPGSTVTNPDGETMRIETATNWWDPGAFVLGLTYDEAVGIFEGENKIEDVKYKFNRALERRGSALRLG